MAYYEIEVVKFHTKLHVTKMEMRAELRIECLRRGDRTGLRFAIFARSSGSASFGIDVVRQDRYSQAPD